MNIKWIPEKLKEEALKYQTRNEFNKKNPNAYHAAYSKKILDSICTHMPKRVSVAGQNNPNFKWADDALAEEAKKYKFRGEFALKSSGAYQMAKDRNVLEKICLHMESANKGENNGNYKYTNEYIKEKALLFYNPGEFKKHYPELYQAARHRKILKEVVVHMEYVNHRPYMESEILELALKCKTNAEFNKKYYGASQAAVRLGILDKVRSHMGKGKDVSYMEQELFNIIKNHYISATRIRDYNVNITNKPHIKRFYLDIYVPELNKAIEFDGKYWHSFDCMRKQEHKRKWSDEDIRNYHEIKDEWFLNSKGIKILHIKEKDWLKDKQKCIGRCLEFLT